MHIFWVVEGEWVGERTINRWEENLFFKKYEDRGVTKGRNCFKKEGRNTEQPKTTAVYYLRCLDA